MSENQALIDELVNAASQSAKRNGIKIVPPDEIDKIAASARGSDRENKALYLQGWDVAAAITMAALNRGFMREKAGAGQFQWPATQSKTASSTLSGTFKPWQVSDFASGSEVSWSIEANDIKFTTAGTDGTMKTFVAPSGTLVLRTHVARLPTNTEGKVPLAPVQTNDTPIEILTENSTIDLVETGTSKPMPALSKIGFFERMTEWFTANLDKFAPMLANVIVDPLKVENQPKAGATLPWLKTSATGYASATPLLSRRTSDGVFAVLSLIDGETDTSSLAYEASLNLIPNGYDASFVIARAKYLEYMLKPSVPIFFEDAKETDFEIVNDESDIVNLRELSLGKMALSNGQVVNPAVKAGEFTLGVEDEQIRLHFGNMSFDAGNGLEASMSYTTYYTLVASRDPGRRKLLMALQPNRSETTLTFSQTASREDLDRYLTYAELGLAVVGIFGGLVGIWGEIAGDGATTVASDAAPAGSVVVRTTAAAGYIDDDATEMSSFGSTEADAESVVDASGVISGAGKFRRIAGIATLAVGFSGTGVLAFTKSLLAGNFEDAKSALLDAKVDFTDRMNNTLLRSVEWPDPDLTLELDSINLNNCLQFGYKAVIPTA